ncbi:hypothetical protein EPR50_G00220100 [Perca flavescens]|uniref:Uncharacterized protein n=1 Tax=Perca flavescens TaxID=8167 RepID=A0A484C024_PERFV|nr:hypothetical protein EPR50_G00220100 [Perca flavescens]
MGERFLVVPVDGGVGVARDGEHDPAPDTGGGGGGGGSSSSSSEGVTVEEKEAGEDSVFEPQDPNAVVPILEYNREPNKYGKTAGRYKLRVPLLISSI